MSAPLVELTAVSKSFREGDRERVILRDADLTVSAGEWVFLLGRSGTGKSTLLNLVSGIDRPDGGDIVVDGQTINRLSERQRTLFRRNHIGFVFQFYNLIPTLTVEENVLLPLELTGALTAGLKGRGADLLAAVGLADRAKTYPDRLSGGEQQRVAVARALIHQPKLVLADEPTGNLDAETGAQVLDIFQRLVRQTGTTMLLVTHSREIATLADRILTISNGRLVDAAGQVAP